MGFLGDVYGRIEGLMITMIIAMIGVLSSSMLSLGSATSTYAIVVASRFLVGIGLGGIYPISAVKSAENSRASTKSSIKDELCFVFYWFLFLMFYDLLRFSF